MAFERNTTLLFFNDHAFQSYLGPCLMTNEALFVYKEKIGVGISLSHFHAM